MKIYFAIVKVFNDKANTELTKSPKEVIILANCYAEAGRLVEDRYSDVVHLRRAFKSYDVLMSEKQGNANE